MNESTSNNVRPTKKQRELLGFIEQFIAEHGYSPSYREIMNGLQYGSVATVAAHINNLIKRGHLIKRDNSARSLEVLTPSGEAEQLKITSNQVTPAEEKWLVEKVERLFAEAELSTEAELPAYVEKLQILVGALNVLELTGAAQSFLPRLHELRERLPK